MVRPLLRAERLVRRYGARPVVAVDELEVRAGEVLAIVGPNGAGKSTLFRLLLMLERADEGTIRIDGAPAAPDDAALRRRLAGVFQRPLLFSGSVSDNVAFGLRARGVRGTALRQRVEDALGWLGIGALAHARVHTLSGGEAQRVALARAVVVQPDILLLDEPTANLDVAIRRQFRHDIEAVARQHARALILITHDAGEAFGLADRIAVMEGGRIVQTGAPEDIALRPETPFVAELTGAELLLHGTVESVNDGLATVCVGPNVRVWAVAPAGSSVRAGAGAVVSYRPEDVVLAPERPTDTSAVNRLPVIVEALVPAGALMRARLRTSGSVVLTALLTRRSVEVLSLRAGARAVAQLKATALHAWPRETHPARGERA